jgi:outer membrane protein OmpA-like peptidoglycan-associated protein
MKTIVKSLALLLSIAIVMQGCKSLSNTAKGGILGGSAGAVIGAGVGVLIGKNAKSAAIGAAVGTAVGTTTGVIIGKKMDKAAEEAARIEGARVDSIRDANNLKAVLVTFDSGILFQTNKSTLNTASKKALTDFAKILNENADMDVAIMGHTDNTGSLEVNQRISLERAKSVATFLKGQNVPEAQIKEIAGKDYSMPVADNTTAEGRSLNRRVEIYLYASEKMIKAAEEEAK